ncbi:MAG: lysophospholipid acyltransferase family protein [Eubacteriaceae bacterium]
MIYKFCRGIVNFINYIWLNFEIIGKENIPSEEGALICPNHLSLYDPCVVASITKREIHFMAKEELFNNFFLGWLLRHAHAFPVNRENVNIETVKESLKVLKDNELLGIFPEGKRVKVGEKVDPANGFIVFAIKTKSPIIPIQITGKMKFRQKVRILVGEPIYLTEYYGKKVSDEETKKISHEIMEKIYGMEV